MTTRRGYRQQHINSDNFPAKKPSKSLVLLFGIVLGLSLVVGISSLPNSFFFTNKEQLALLQSETFASQDYRPIKIGAPETIANYDFTEIDKIAASLNYRGSSVEELAALLLTHATTDLEKARIIYAWITQHISYDVPAFLDAINNGNYPVVTPTKVLSDRTTICSGYSNLYLALAEAMDLQG